MQQSIIVDAPREKRGFFITTTKNTDISQRDTLEEIICNLAAVAGAQVVYKQANSRGAYFYEVQLSGFSGFQSASNTILELSRTIRPRG